MKNVPSWAKPQKKAVEYAGNLRCVQHVSSADLLALDEDHHPKSFVAWSMALPGKEMAEAAIFVVKVLIFNASLNISTFRDTLSSSLGKTYFEKARLTLFSRWTNVGKNRWAWNEMEMGSEGCVEVVTAAQDLTRCKTALWFSPPYICSKACDPGVIWVLLTGEISPTVGIWEGRASCCPQAMVLGLPQKRLEEPAKTDQ